ncbi:MAG: Hint domain-containing protein [Propionibacteriaceae bacterium]
MTLRQPPTRLRWWRLLLAALAAVLGVLLGAMTASATTLSAAETRVGASTVPTPAVVGVDQAVWASQHQVDGPPLAGLVVATGVAAKAACFTAGTPVLLANGTSKPIEQVAVGDKVTAYDPETGQPESRDVVRTFVHYDVATFEVTLGSGAKVTTTEEHPFWVDGQGWTPANRLKTGDNLRQSDGRPVRVGSVQATGKTATVYNFEVEGLHNYYVQAGDTWVLVHNDCTWAVDALSQSGARIVAKDLTRAGQELAKHSGEGAFPIAQGSPSVISRTAQNQLDDILTAPGTSIKDITQGNFAGGRYYVAPDGRGAAFDSSGAFQYFGVFTP